MASLYVALTVGLYLHGLRLAPQDLAPARTQAPAAMRALWLRAEAPAAKALPRLDPVTFIPREFLDARGRMGHGGDPQASRQQARRVPGDVSRRVASRAHGLASARNGRRHLAEIAVMIHIGRHWTLDDAANTFLIEAHYGRGAIGIEAAAQAYFGVSADALRDEEALALIVLARGPSWYGIDCGKTGEHFVARYAKLAQGLGTGDARWTVEGALARLRPAACTQRGNRTESAVVGIEPGSNGEIPLISALPLAGHRKKPVKKAV